MEFGELSQLKVVREEKEKNLFDLFDSIKWIGTDRLCIREYFLELHLV